MNLKTNTLARVGVYHSSSSERFVALKRRLHEGARLRLWKTILGLVQAKERLWNYKRKRLRASIGSRDKVKTLEGFLSAYCRIRNNLEGSEYTFL